ncbi:MAG TPA: hypothetical protein VJV78_43325 [Polyangiales bacterium]|nr:hypothetical protein [Polyangiales bacterium]
MKRLVSIALLSVLCAGMQPHAAGQDSEPNPSECQLRVATGKKGRVFSKLLRDIRKLCGSQVQLCEIETEGGLQNTTALSTNEADLGFVQIDTLQTMRRSDDNVATLQAVMPMNVNLLHILALREGYTVRGERRLSTLFMRNDKTIVVRKLSDLRGLPVAVVGSAQLLGLMLERTYHHGWRFVSLATDEQAIAALRAGEVAAVFCMSGWPSSTVDALPRDADIALVAYDLQAQSPNQIVRKNYPKAGVFNLTFLAAPNLLVTRPFNPAGTRGRHVAALQHCVLGNLEALQEGDFDPGWKEIKDPEEVYGWARFDGQTAPKVSTR